MMAGPQGPSQKWIPPGRASGLSHRMWLRDVIPVDVIASAAIRTVRSPKSESPALRLTDRYRPPSPSGTVP